MLSNDWVLWSGEYSHRVCRQSIAYSIGEVGRYLIKYQLMSTVSRYMVETMYVKVDNNSILSA